VTRDFATLFKGGEHGYGLWDPTKSKEEAASTLRGPAPPEAYARHLAGKVGLGLTPVTKNGTCFFGAIDIDEDTIDHKKLFSKIDDRKLPLNVCRSKSGGAHLYIFPVQPIQASKLQTLLRRWATELGYGKSEIFPKQAQISVDNIGNWINLPYFAGDKTTRYAIGSNGALSLQEFLETVLIYDPNQEISAFDIKSVATMPPCLQILSESKLPEGTRNVTLFNFAVFYRKSQPADWENALTSFNANNVAPPLAYREIQSIIKSAGRTKYQYTCENSPLRDYCDRALCQTLPFGVGHKPWQEEGTYDELLISNFRKVSSTPPRYILEVSGQDVEFSAEEFLNFSAFRRIVYMVTDKMVQPMKQPQWEQMVKELTATKTDIEAPEDASFDGLVIECFHSFLALRERSIRREDILRGLPVLNNDKILFRASDFRRHLQIFKLDKLDPGQLFLLLKKHGAEHSRVRVSGKLVTLWSFPLINARTQTEDFEVPQFDEKQSDEI
jgi:hypothetical protein